MPQGVDKRTYRTVTHALRAVEFHYPTPACCEICRKETHGCSSRADIDIFRRSICQSAAHGCRIVAISHLKRRIASGHGIKYERAGTYAFGKRKPDFCLQQFVGRKNSQIHDDKVN